MFKVYTKEQNSQEKPLILACKKFHLKSEEVELAASDSFLFSTIFVFAISNKKAYLFSTDKKEPEVFESKQIDKIYVEKKTDLNLALKGGRIVNLTSVVSVKPKAFKLIKFLAEEVNRLK